MAWHDQPKERDHPGVAAYIAGLDERQTAIVDQMRRIVREDPDVVECIAWGIPFWFRKGPLVYASAAKSHVTLGIARGVEVQDRFGLLQGTGKSPIRKAVVKLGKPFPEDAVRDWVEQAVVLDEAGEDEAL